ncbi:MAG: hypothetical protein Q7K44_00690 [Candidatus Liptonbacteria bacterium]|nr:hypothetical protein [Candidatus Liptonbacteria bacterium]
MELIELLKKLKNIKPDSDYSRKSRLVILSHGSTQLTINKESRLPVFSFSFKQVATGVLRSGWAMALTAIFLFLTIGSFSVLKILSPATTAVVDLTGLKAEAQAIDAQIELTNVVYNASVGIENKTSTSSIILRETKSPKAATKQAESGVKPNATGLAEDASAQPTIDSALDILSR